MIAEEIFRHGKFVFDVAYLSEKGSRPVNEDSLMMRCDSQRAFFCAADGLGAHGGGDIASRIAVDVVTERYMGLDKPTPENVYSIFRDADIAIVAAQTETLKMKTTLSCLLCMKKHMYAAHSGDTRIYTFKKNAQQHITRDHTIAYEQMIQNRGSLEDIRKNPYRHILTAALGIGGIRPPDIFGEKISYGMSVMICSDGFWEFVEENDMVQALRDTHTSREWLSAMLECHRVKTDKPNDNYSAICLRIKK